MSAGAITIRDSLYGIVRLDEELAALAATPVVQRLRHVRLSNIDSLDMPGIANLSRYEHVLGAAHLANAVGVRTHLSRFEHMVLVASALLHDWAITAFGHLVEEAFQYVGAGFDHEDHLREIISGEMPEEIGGVRRQVLEGRETGLPQWARSVVTAEIEAERLLAEIMEHIRGRGRLGPLISGEIDLDNIDSVFRMAFHMGLEPDREIAIRLANAMVDFDRGTGEPIFARAAEVDIRAWLTTRRRVYEHLMLAPRDFAGKVMMLYAAIRAFEAGEISKVDWNLTDHGLVCRLTTSTTRDVREAASRWVAGELWDLAALHWMEGDRPDYGSVLSFSRELSDVLGRTCLAYAIKDKRDRRLTIRFDDGAREELGGSANRWLLGIGSPTRKRFLRSETRAALDHAASFFGTRVAGVASPAPAGVAGDQPWLL